MFQNKMWNCPNCQKKAFHLSKEWTMGICDKCGFEIDYEKIPFLKNIMDLLNQVKGAIKIPLDGNDLDIKEENKTEEE